jgi:branched-chain amino acid transport system permease protein
LRYLLPDEPIARAAGGTVVLGLIVIVVSVISATVVGKTFTTILLIYVVGVVGLGIYMGNSGIMSFGHAGFMGLAAYVSGILSMPSRETVLHRFPEELASLSVPVLAGAAIALGAVAIFAAFVGLAISRLSVYAAGIASLGVLVIVNTTLLAASDITNGGSPLYGIVSGVQWPLALGTALVAIAIARLFRESNSGLQLRSSREDELAVKAVGVNVQRVRLLSWVLSATVTGAAGVLLGHFLGAFSPTQFYLQLTVTLVAMLVVGGRGTVSGAVIGAALVTGVLELLGNLEGGIKIGPLDLPEFFGLPTLGLAIVLVATVYFRREGLLRVEIDEVLSAWIERGSRTVRDPEAVISTREG